MNFLVVGLGLIGGSICKALSAFDDFFVYGYDKNPQAIEAALKDNAIKGALTDADLHMSDVTIVCLHPVAARTFLESAVPYLKKESLVFDVCGIKGGFVYDMTDMASRHDVFYIGTHPMAGKERFGYENSDAKIFKNANFIITPTDKTEESAINLVKDLAYKMGFGKITYAEPYEHDRMIAYTSQLAHIVSNAYVKSDAIKSAAGFSGGSFQDMTRIAAMNEEMWTSLFLLNKEFLLDEVDTLIENLSQYREAIATGDGESLSNLLKDGRTYKETFA